MKSIKIFIVIAVISLFSACAAPRYSGSSIITEIENSKPDIVIVKDAKTREGFLMTIQKWLDNNDYKYTVVNEGSAHDLKKLTIEYVGYWKWDLALYLSQAKIDAFYNGQRVGEVEYKAPNSLNTNKFSNAEERIEYMLAVLFGKISTREATKVINTSKNR